MEREKVYLVDLIRHDPEKAEILMGELLDTFKTHVRMLDALEAMIAETRKESPDLEKAIYDFIQKTHVAMKTHGVNR